MDRIRQLEDEQGLAGIVELVEPNSRPLPYERLESRWITSGLDEDFDAVFWRKKPGWTMTMVNDRKLHADRL